MVELPYGRTPYRFDLRGRSATVVGPPPQPAPIDVSTVFERALGVPIGRPRLETLVSAGAWVTIVVSDQTRNEPRAELVAAVRARLPSVHLTIIEPHRPPAALRPVAQPRASPSRRARTGSRGSSSSGSTTPGSTGS